MRRTYLGRTCAGIAASAVAALVAAGTVQPATAASAPTSGPSAHAELADGATPSASTPDPASREELAEISPVGDFPSIAVVRGADSAVWATTGKGFADLGGRVLDDPAVAAAPNQLWFLGKGTDSRLWLRTADTDWQLAGNSPVVGSSLTAAYYGGYLLFSYVDPTYRVHLGVIDPVAPTGPTVASDQLGPYGFGAAVNASAQPLYIGSEYVPGLLWSKGSLYQWDGGPPFDPDSISKRYLSCAKDRFGAAVNTTNPTYPTYPVGAVVCRSPWDDSVHFLGKGIGQDIGGKIVGSPGIALRASNDLDSIVYGVGTDKALWVKTVLDEGDEFTSSEWTKIGGKALGGVQATSWSLLP